MTKAFSSTHFARRAITVARVTALAVCLIGALALLGWIFDVARLKSVLPGLIEMKANTALALLVAGLGLVAATPPPNAGELSTIRRRIARGCGVLVGVIGALTLAEHLGAPDLGIDQLLFRDTAVMAATYFPGRMAPLTAINLIFVGAALWLIQTRIASRAVPDPTEWLASAVALTSALVLFGYVFGVHSLVNIQDYTTMALHTGAALLLVAVSLLASRPNRMLMTRLGSEGPGGILARRLLPAAMLVPVLLAWLGLVGERFGWFSQRYGLAIETAASVFIYCVLVVIAAGALSREDAGRRRAERALREAESKYRSIFEHSEDGIFQTAPDGHFITANPAMARLFGCATPDDLMATMSANDVYAEPDGRARFLRRLARDGAVTDLECEIRARDGRRRWVSENARAVRDTDGTLLYVEGTLRDITDRKQAERALQDSERLLRESQVIAGLGSYVLDIATARWTSSPVLDDLLGLEPHHEHTVDSWAALIHADDRDEMRAYLADDVIGRHQRFDREYRIIRARDGAVRWVHGLGEVERDADHRPVRMVGTISDITERREKERALQLRGAALDAAANLILITDGDGTIEWANAAVAASTGYDLSEVIGRNPRDLFKSGTHDPAFYKELWDTLLAGRVWRGEMVNRCKDGSLRPEDVTITPIVDRAGACTHFIAVKQDISERKRKDARLLEQAQLLDHAQDAIIVSNLEHRITYWNQGAERMYGWTTAEAISQSFPDVFCRNRDRFGDAQSAVLASGEWSGELMQQRKDGTALTVQSRWALVRDAAGAPKSVLMINTDITERKHLELQFLRAQRLESIGTLAGGIAHDLNNVLAPIMMSIDLLKLKAADDDSRTLVDTIGASAQRGADMVRQVLSFARGLEGRRVDVQVRHLIREMEKIARETFPKNIRLATATNRDLWTVSGDPTQLHQVLLNLCINARDAMPDGGDITVAADNVVFDEQEAARYVGAHDGSYVVVEVRDTGSGIPPSIIDKIFDPFFTTKEVGKGTGLGLSTSLTIVRQHGGFVRVDSEVGVGTRFRVYLPAEVTAHETIAEVAEADSPHGSGETVLVVDDEIAIREIARQTLEAFGYRVLLAADGAEAVSIYAQQGDGIAVVLIDLMMPGLDGASTIQVLAKMNADIRIIAMSGRAAGSQQLPDAGTADVRFLPKPFTAEALLQALRATRPPNAEQNLHLFE